MSRLGALLYAGALFSLPWVGLDLVRLLSGRDLGAGFQTSYLLMAGACLCWLPGARSSGAAAWRASDLRWRWLLAGTLAVVLASALGLAVAPAGTGAGTSAWRFGKQAAQLGVVLVFVAAPYARTRTVKAWETTRRLLAAAVLFELIYGALQALYFRQLLPWFGPVERLFTSNPAILSGSEQLYLGRGFTELPRLRGTACEPLYLGSFLLAALPFVLEDAGRRRRHAWIAAGGALLLLWTWSRGAWLGAVAGAAAGAALLGRAGLLSFPRRRALLAALAVVVAVTAVLALARPDLLALPGRRVLQSFSREDWSNLTRLYSMQAAWRAFALSPVVGIGWGQFAFHFPALVDPQGLQSQFNWPVVNSFPLEILCETGLLGFVVFAAGAVMVARAVWSATGRGTSAGLRLGPDGRRRVAVAAAATVAVWSQLLTFSQYNLPHLWVPLGLLLAALRPLEAGSAADSADGDARGAAAGVAAGDAAGAPGRRGE